MIQRQRKKKPVFSVIPRWLNAYHNPGITPDNPEYHYYATRDEESQPITIYVKGSEEDSYIPMTMHLNIQRNLHSNIQIQKDESGPKDFSYLKIAEHEEQLTINVSKDDVIQQSSWVRKYQPTRFIDLLTDELHNRNVLTWLKSWDEIVFKRHVKKIQTTANIFRKGANLNGKYSFFPQQFNYKKLILLAGPPGCGKTTLARVLAKHCGYHWEEINASDDRSAKTLISKIDNFVTNKTVGREQKPICVIIDEVDGALDSENNGLKEVLQYLQTGVIPNENRVKVTKGEKGAKKDAKDTKETKETKQNKNTKYSRYDPKIKQVPKQQTQERKTKIDRPIIFICNDPFVRGLKQLRGKAIVVYFNTLQEQRVVKRLKEITQRQEVYIQTDLLSKICQMCNNDVRSSVSILQMLVKFKRHQNLNPKDVLNRLRFSFAKDSTTSTNQFLQKINSLKTDNKNIITSYMHFLEQHDNPALLFETFFHNLPAHKQVYYHLDKASQLYSQIRNYDISVRQHHGQTDDFSLLPYAHFRIHFKPDEQKKIEFPSIYFQRMAKLRANKALHQKIHKEINPSLQVFISSSVLVKDYLYILWMTMQTSSTREDDVLRCVYKMLTYGFRLGIRGGQHLFLPEIDQLLTFGAVLPEIMLSNTSRGLMEENYEFLKMKCQLVSESLEEGKQSYENVINQLKKNRRKHRQLHGGVVKYKFLEGTGTEIKYDIKFGYFFERRSQD